MFFGTVNAGGSTTRRTPMMSNLSWASDCDYAETALADHVIGSAAPRIAPRIRSRLFVMARRT
jgi:hypothetical protein